MPGPVVLSRTAAICLVACSVAASGGVSTPRSEPRQPAADVQVTVAATAEEASEPVSGAGGSAGGLVIQVSLANRAGFDLAALQVRIPVPPRARVVDSWIEEPGKSPGVAGGGFVTWRNLALRDGARLGPLTYRLLAEPGADGAVIFREAKLRPEITWQRPTLGTAAAPELRLNGLWGDGGLRRTVLPTGLTVLSRERPDSDTVAVRIAVRAGSRDEDDTTSGGSHWLEHAHFLGTARRSAEEIASAIADVGGGYNAATSWEATDYWHLVPAEHFDLALDVLADQIVHSTFRDEAFERERNVVFEELKRRDDTPTIRAFDEFINLVFRVSPLRRHPGGTIESVQSIPVPTMLAYRDERYVTGNMAVAAVGRLRHDATVAAIEDAFSAIARRGRSERPPVAEPIQTEPRWGEVGEGTRAVEIRLGWPAPGDADPDGPAMYLIDDILGTTGRRLAEEIRDRRALARTVSPTYINFTDAGALIPTSTLFGRAERL